MSSSTTASDGMSENGEKLDPESERKKRLRSKNLTMLAILAGLVVLFYVVALVRMGGG